MDSLARLNTSLAVAVIALVSGCRTEVEPELLSVDAASIDDDAVDTTFSMMIETLDDLDPDTLRMIEIDDTGSLAGAVVVPSDDALLALDADALADLAVDRDLARYVHSIRLDSERGGPLLEDDALLITEEGVRLDVVATPDGFQVDGHQVVTTVQRNELFIVVLDGVVQP